MPSPQQQRLGHLGKLKEKDEQRAGILKTSVIVFPVLWQSGDLAYGLFTLPFSWLIQRVGHYESGFAKRCSGFQLLTLGQPGTWLMAGPWLCASWHTCWRLCTEKITLEKDFYKAARFRVCLYSCKGNTQQRNWLTSTGKKACRCYSWHSAEWKGQWDTIFNWPLGWTDHLD